MKWIGLFLAVIGVQSAMGEAAFVDIELKRVYPRPLAGLAFDVAEKYNEAFGYSLFYSRGADFKLELSVYDLERGAIETGHDVDGIALVLDYLESELNKQLQNEAITDLRKRGVSVVPAKGETQFSNVIFQYSTEQEIDGQLKPVSRVRSIYVTGAHNNFFVAKLDWNAAEGKTAKGVVEKLVEQLAEIIDNTPDDKEMLLAACEAAIRDPASYAGQVSAQYVVQVAQAQGNLQVYEGLFAWPDGYRKPKNADLLVAAYFAGMLQVVVPEDLGSGGGAEAFDAMLRAYETMRANNQIQSITQLDEWLKVSDTAERYKKALIDCEYLAP